MGLIVAQKPQGIGFWNRKGKPFNPWNIWLLGKIVPQYDEKVKFYAERSENLSEIK